MSDRRRELLELTRVRVLLFLREPEAIFWVFVFPLFLAGVLGFAFRSQGIEPARVALLDGPGSEELAAALLADEHLELERGLARAEARRKLARASIDLVLEPVAEGPPLLVLDPARSEGEQARVRVLRAIEQARPGARPAEARLEPLTETGSRYVDFLFPGLLGMNIMGTGMWGIGYALADVRRRKFLKRLLVTPMRHSSFFLSFILSRLVFLAMEVAVLGGFAAWVLGVPYLGSLAAFALACMAGAFCFAGLGILTASRVRTLEGVNGMLNVVMMPMWLGSGVFFSYERFPEALWPVLRLLPLTILNDALRAVQLDGAGLLATLPAVGGLLAFGVASLLLALRIFRWE